MDHQEFKAAFEAPYEEPSIDSLVERFQRAFDASNGDTQTAMVAVNEFLVEPMRYEEFLSRMRSET